MKIMPPTLTIILLILSIILNFVLPIKKIMPFPYTLIGIIFILFGIVVNIWADQLFRKAKTTVKPDQKPTSLQTNGPFRISRHPMYLGMLAILLGAGIFMGTLITFIFPIIFIIIIESIFIPLEEKNLKKSFGKQYLEYKKRVRRWI